MINNPAVIDSSLSEERRMGNEKKDFDLTIDPFVYIAIDLYCR